MRDDLEALWDTELPLTQFEALLIDWVYVVHQWSEDWCDRCQAKLQLRERLSRCVEKEGGIIRITTSELEELLVMTPTFFQLGGVDAGLSLKLKLYALLRGESLVKHEEPRTEASTETKVEEAPNVNYSNPY